MDKLRFGLKKSVIEKICAVFAKYPEVDTVIIYGSRAKGNYKNGSDIDLSMKGKLLTLSLQFKIEDQIDDLLLPYSFDLSILEQITDTSVVEHINRVGKIFYSKTPVTSEVGNN